MNVQVSASRYKTPSGPKYAHLESGEAVHGEQSYGLALGRSPTSLSQGKRLTCRFTDFRRHA